MQPRLKWNKNVEDWWNCDL